MDDVERRGSMFSVQKLFLSFLLHCPSLYLSPRKELIIYFVFFLTPGGKFLVDTVHLMKTTGKNPNHLVWYLNWWHSRELWFISYILGLSRKGFSIGEEKKTSNGDAELCTVRWTYTRGQQNIFTFDLVLTIFHFNALMVSRECLKRLFPFPH